MDQLLLAAKCSPALESINEAYSKVIGTNAETIFSLQQELSQLRTAYKEALEALEALSEHNYHYCSCHFKGTCSSCLQIERKKKALTNPLAIEVMKVHPTAA